MRPDTTRTKATAHRGKPGVHRGVPSLVVPLTLALTAALSLFGIASPASAADCLTIPSGIEAWWPGDDTGDELVHGRDGTLANGADYTTGVVGQAFTFDGVDDVVTVADDPAWDLGSADFTQAMWVKFDALDQPMTLTAQDEGPNDQPKWLLHMNEGSLIFHINGPAGASNPISTVWAPTPATWHHVAVVRTGPAWSLFIDGSLASAASSEAVVPAVSAELALGLGEPGYALDGALDEVMFFHRSLSTAEVKAIYDAGATGLCDPIATTLSMQPSKTTLLNGMTVTINGDLGIEGSLAADRDGHTITVTRSVDGALPEVVATPTTVDGGFYEFTDTPPLGKVRYTAWFEGSGNAVPASAKVTILVEKGASQVTLSAGDRSLVIGQSTKLTAELVGGRVNREVTIWAKPVGETKRVVKRGAVGSDDMLVASVTPRMNTTYWATYAGDISWKADTSREIAVGVRVKWREEVLRDYAKSGKYHLFHYTSPCADDGKSCPTFKFELLPAHPRVTVTLQWEIQRANGSWNRVYQHNFDLNRESVTYIWYRYTDRQIGLNQRMRLVYGGDATHKGAPADWIYYRITR